MRHAKTVANSDGPHSTYVHAHSQHSLLRSQRHLLTETCRPRLNLCEQVRNSQTHFRDQSEVHRARRSYFPFPHQRRGRARFAQFGSLRDGTLFSTGQKNIPIKTPGRNDVRYPRDISPHDKKGFDTLFSACRPLGRLPSHSI